MNVQINVALADDHFLLRKGLRMLIEEFENMHVVADAGNGRELLDALSSMSALPEVCILDVKMPELNGFETLLELKQRWPMMRVLMLSMFSNELNIVKLIRNGADGYLVKDCSPKELRAAIQHVYHGGTYYPRELLHYISKVETEGSADVLPELNPKEYLFLAYCSTDLTYKEIADRMHQSLRTIEGYRDQLLKKLNIRSRVGLATYAIEAGIDCIGNIGTA